jgi:two-component system, OmpR family, response regulator
MHILLVEDEQKIADFVTQGLLINGFRVTHCTDGLAGLQALQTGSFAVAVLDVMLPTMSGLDVLSGARQLGISTPVIILSAKGDLTDKLAGFSRGSDDYLPKPFYTEELVARINALIARQTARSASDDFLVVDDLALNLLTREAIWSGHSVSLTAREFGLLEYLMRSPGYVFSRKQILEHVWKISFDPQTNVVDVCVKRIKKKIFDNESSLITSVRGVGYSIGDSTVHTQHI